MKGGVAVGGRRVEPPNYCISGHMLWYCTAALNRSLSSFNHRVFWILSYFIFSSQLIVIEEEEVENVSIEWLDDVSTSSSGVKFYQSHISHFYCLIFLLLVFHKCQHLLFWSWTIAIIKDYIHNTQCLLLSWNLKKIPPDKYLRCKLKHLSNISFQRRLLKIGCCTNNSCNFILKMKSCIGIKYLHWQTIGWR